MFSHRLHAYSGLGEDGEVKQEIGTAELIGLLSGFGVCCLLQRELPEMVASPFFCGWI